MKNLVASLLVLGLAQASWAATLDPVIDVYKSPTCGCCNKWIDHLKANGFTVRAHDTENVAAHKIRLGVPVGYGSCHTAEVNGYVIEGHVP
ncbi:MAG: metal-binding protein, partial [Hydrogenophilales bacterium 32-62-9]